MSILTLSGWGQPHNALSSLYPQADHFDYASKTFDESLQALSQMNAYQTVIGWSLGGQLALRATSAGILRPEKIILIATPFQFVASSMSTFGMRRDQYDKFFDNYKRNPQRTLQKGWELIAKGDTHAGYVKTQMMHYDPAGIGKENWLYWLEQLAIYNSEYIDFSRIPTTLLIHGKGDAVVGYEQSQHFLRYISKAHLELLPNSGHAPHWHAPEAVRACIDEYIHV